MNDRMDLQWNNVHIWNIEANLESNQAELSIDFLSPDEIERASKYKFERDRRVFITARSALRRLLGKYLGIDPTKIGFFYNSYGKPNIIQDKQLNFNVSHSEKNIVIAFAKGLGIGVDIEKIKNDFDPMELAENFFSQEEIKALSNHEEESRYRAFYRCWTRKESFIKALGQGLSYPLDSFAVSLDNDHTAQFLKIDGIPDPKKSWQLLSFIPAEGYIAALSTNVKPKAIQFFDWSRHL